MGERELSTEGKTRTEEERLIENQICYKFRLLTEQGIIHWSRTDRGEHLSFCSDYCGFNLRIPWGMENGWKKPIFHLLISNQGGEKHRITRVVDARTNDPIEDQLYLLANSARKSAKSSPPDDIDRTLGPEMNVKTANSVLQKLM